MRASRRRHLPDHDVSEPILAQDQLLPQQQYCPHVGFYTNIKPHGNT
jgi:hypothetical protein